MATDVSHVLKFDRLTLSIPLVVNLVLWLSKLSALRMFQIMLLQVQVNFDSAVGHTVSGATTVSQSEKVTQSKH